MSQSRIFERPKTLEHSFIPPKLPTREKELSSLEERILSNFREKRAFDGIVLDGGVGSGKTHLAKRVAKNIEKKENITHAYTNCRFNRRTYKTLTNLVKKVESSIPSHGLSQDELLRILIRLVKQKEKKAIFILDEIDALFWGEEEKKAEDTLYTLSRLPESLELNDVSYTVIAISRQADLYKSLDKPTRASFIQREMTLKQYTKKNLLEILQYRSKLAFKSNGITIASIDQIASHIAENASGNARVGVDLLYETGKFGEKQGKNQITSSIVRKILGQHPTLPGIDREMLRGLGKHKLLFLLGIIRALRNEDKGFVTKKIASEFYRIACENFGAEARRSTQIHRYLTEMNEKLPILNTSVTGKGRVGRSTEIGISAPLDQLEAKVEKILENM